MKIDFKITGLDCANCARELEEELNKLDGVQSATVDFMMGKVVLECSEDGLKRAVDACNNFEDAKVEGDPVGDLLVDSGANGSQNTKGAAGKKIKIANLCCANCGRELEEKLNKLEGVTATVDFMNMTVILNTGDRAAYDRAISIITHFEDVKIVDGNQPQKSVFMQNIVDIIAVLVSAVCFIPALVMDLMHLGGIAQYFIYALYGVAFVAAGYIVLFNTARNVCKGKIFDENFLMALASIGALVLGITTGDGLFEGVAVMLLYRIGELLQSVAVGSSRRSITDLMDLKSDTATLITADGEQQIVSPENLSEGDKIMIKAGEKVPVDCIIESGASSFDLKSLNGEAMPRDAAEGDELLSGSINLSGVVEARVLREYKNSAVAKILELVENSTSKKAQSEKFISKFAKYYTPAVVLAAVIVAALVPTIICAVNADFVWLTYRGWIYRALSFLVISCPCALVISVPLSYFVGIGRCARSGILVKGSTCLDSLALTQVAAFDKTGTLTKGVFEVKSFTSKEALEYAAAAEKFSSHPIALAFKGVDTPYVAEGAAETAGRGITCTVKGKKLLCGNALMLKENSVAFEEKESLSTLVYVALDGQYVGVIEIDDVIKEGAVEAIAALKKAGVKSAYMLTGDGKLRAEEVGKAVGLDGVRAGLLPDEKLACAGELKAGGKLLYVGDGINDAPVMTAADCAVSMGQVGSDAAIEASDVVLVSDKLSLLAEGKRVARGTRRIVIENVVGSLAVKLAIMALSIALPAFPLIAAIFGDVGVMLIAVLNALRVRLIK